MLHSPNREDLEHGATVLALKPRIDPDLFGYTNVLIIHPSVEVRSVAASTAVLDELTQLVSATDLSPQVRAKLATRWPPTFSPPSRSLVLASLRALT